MRITVTLARQLGSGGATLGNSVADRLGIRCLDREIVSHAAQQLDADESELAAREEHGATFWERMLRGINVNPPEALYQHPTVLAVSDRDLFAAETEVMRKIAEQEDCVIVGRAACHMLPVHPGMVNIFLHAPLSFRIPRVRERFRLADDDQARAMITRSDEGRKRFIAQTTGRMWDSAHNYHLCLDTSVLPLPDIADLLTDYIRRRLADEA